MMIRALALIFALQIVATNGCNVGNPGEDEPEASSRKSCHYDKDCPPETPKCGVFTSDKARLSHFRCYNPKDCQSRKFYIINKL